MLAEVAAPGALGGVGDHTAPGSAYGGAGQMLGEKTDDMMVDHDAFIHAFLHHVGEEADGGAAAAQAHLLFLNAVDDGRLAGPHFDFVLFIDRDFHFLAVGQLDDGPGGFEAAVAGEAVGAADGHHFGAVFLGVYHADMLAVAVYLGALLTDVGVGVQFYGYAGVA